MRFLRRFAIIASVFLANCATPFSLGKLLPPPADGHTVRLLSRTLPIVEVSARKGRSAPFVLDTGSYLTVVTPRQADQWRLTTRRLLGTTLDGPSGSIVAHDCVSIDRLSFGSVSTSALHAVVVDLPSLITGIIGASLMSDYPVLFDASNLTVRIIPRDAVEQVLDLDYPCRQWSKLPLVWQEHYPLVELSAGGEKLRMLVDTGSSESHIAKATIQRLGLRSIRERLDVRQNISGQDVQSVAVVRLGGISYGAWSVDLESASLQDNVLAAQQLDGELGFDLLGRIPFVFDVPGNLLWVMDPASSAESVIRVSEESAWESVFQDPFTEFRIGAAGAVVETRRFRFLSKVATLLIDPVPEVRDAAASYLSTLAKEQWSKESRVESAKAWWNDHKDDPEFREAMTREGE